MRTCYQELSDFLLTGVATIGHGVGSILDIHPAYTTHGPQE
jgi:hypothetical protein